MHNTAVSSRETYDRCTQFTTEHGLDTSDDSDVFGAFVCPACETHNPLTGDPADFREQVVRCMGCTQVTILDATALVAFATAGGDHE